MNKLKGEPGSTIVADTAIDEPRKVRVIQAGQDASFAQEARMDGVEVEAAPDELERDILVEIGLVALAAIDDAHAAASNQFDDSERAKPGADQLVRGWFVRPAGTSCKAAIVLDVAKMVEQALDMLDESVIAAGQFMQLCIADIFGLIQKCAGDTQCATVVRFHALDTSAW